MSETPCKYLLHSKSSFNSLYTLNLLHIPECKLLITKFYLNIPVPDAISSITGFCKVITASLIAL